jgi:hypothetical protein
LHGPKMPEWLQLILDVIKARGDDLPGELEALWEDNAVIDGDRAKAIFWARRYAKGNIGTWLFQHPSFPVEAVSNLIVSRQMGQGFDDFLFGWQNVNADLLAAAIRKRVPLFQDEGTLLLNLLKAGGVALADLALHNGYRLSFQTNNVRKILAFCPFINCTFLERCQIWKIDTSLVRPGLALYCKDLQLVNNFLPESISDALACQLVKLAIHRGWGPGLELIVRRWGLAACTQELYNDLCWRGGEGKERERNNMEFWDAALELGPGWPDAVFAAAFSFDNFAVVERAIQKGALRRSSGAPRGVWSLAPQSWLRDMRCYLDSLMAWGLRMRTASERRLIYVAALVDQEIAQVVEPDLKRALKAIYPLLRWWNRQARTLAQTHGDALRCDLPEVAENVLEQPSSDLPTHRGAPGCHLPDFVENVLDQAGLDLPQVWRQAEAVAVVIREWAGLPEPSNSILRLIGTSAGASALG